MPTLKERFEKFRIKKTQTYMFAFEAINTIFQRTPGDFDYYLERDGIKFLQFWWNKVGLDVPEGQRVEAKGLAYTHRKLEDGREVTLITLPKPTKAPEAYFLALIPKPLKHNYFFKWKNNTRLISLEYKLDENDLPTTQLGEWTYRFNHFKIEGNCQADLEAFWRTVYDMYRSKKD
ncbi:MAG: hypothetical protein AB9891_09030 [Anaerolineaceae bacterium]